MSTMGPMGLMGPMGVMSSLSINNQSRKSADYKQKNGVNLIQPHTHKSEAKNQHTRDEGKPAFRGSTEILARHQLNCGSRDKTDNNRAYGRKHVVYMLRIAVFYQKTADIKHYKEWQPQDRQRGKDRANHCHPLRIALIDCHGIACIGRTVDTNGPGCRLAYSHNIRKLSIGQPSVLLHNLVLQQRNHRISAAEVEYSNLGKHKKYLKKQHFSNDLNI